MTITTRRVTGPIVLPDGTVPRNGRVTYQLSGWDREDGEAVVMGPVTVTLDGGGVFDDYLWCTDTGENGRVYVGVVAWHDGKQSQSLPVMFDVQSGAGTQAFAPSWVVGDLPESTQADALAQCLAASVSASASAGLSSASAAQAAISAASAALYAPAYYQSASAFFAASTAWPVGTRINIRTGGVLDVVAAGTGNFNHPVSGVGLRVVQDLGRVTPEHFGGTRYRTLTAATTGADSATAVYRAMTSGLPIEIDGYYRCMSSVDVYNVDISLTGIGKNGLVFTETDCGVTVHQHTLGVTLSTYDFYRTNIHGVGFYTTLQEAGDALQIVYHSSVLTYGRNEQLVTVEGNDFRGHDTRSAGWSRNVVIVDVNHPDVNQNNIVGRQNSAATSGTLPFYMNGLEGITVFTTVETELNYVKIRRNRIKNILTGIKVTGPGEGMVILDNAIPVCNYGVVLDKTVSDPNITDPQVMIFGNHINAATRCIVVKKMYEVQIADNLLYSFPSVDTGSWAAIEGATLLQGQIHDNIIEGFASQRTDTLIGILGTDIRKTVIEGNHYINIDVPVEFTSSACTENEVRREKRSPSTDTSPMVVHSGTAATARNYVGPVAAKNSATVTVTSSAAAVVSASQDMWGGQTYRVDAVLRGTKGATGGNVAADLVQASGAAAIAFATVAAANENLLAGQTGTIAFSAFFAVSTSGTLALALRASSAGSDLTVSAGQASIVITKVS